MSACQCPLCGKLVDVEPSSFPTLDAPCPCCGHLLWFESAVEGCPAPSAGDVVADQIDLNEQWSPPKYLGVEGVADQEEPYGVFERVSWGLIAAFSTSIVWLHDQTIWQTVVWCLIATLVGQLLLPILFRRASRLLTEDEPLYLAVALGWTLVPGPVAGVVMGVLTPYVYSLPVSAVMGGLCGLVVGPAAAVLMGLTIVGTVDCAVRLVTGKSLASCGRET